MPGKRLLTEPGSIGKMHTSHLGQRQVVEAVHHSGMLCPEYALTLLFRLLIDERSHTIDAQIHMHPTDLTQQADGPPIVSAPQVGRCSKSAQIQGGSLSVPSAPVDLACHPLQEVGRLCSCQFPPLDKIRADPGMRDVVFHLLRWRRRKSLLHCLHRQLSPETLPRFIHSVLQHGLNEPVNREQIRGGVAPDEGISEQYLAGLIQLQGAVYNGAHLSVCSKGACEQDLFWDGIGMQEGAQIEQFGCRRALLLNSAERDRPGGCYRFFIICVQLFAFAASRQEFLPMLLV